MWRFLHASSFAFPEDPDATRQKQMFEFLISVGRVLPCKTCRDHYNDYIRENLTDRVVMSKGTLIEWIVELHNSVNRRTGKREWKVEEVRKHYESQGQTKSSCPAKKTGTMTPATWVVVVILLGIIGLFVASQVRRIPN